MKIQPGLLLLLLLSVVLYGCPYQSPYGIDEQPVQYIDESLLGKWAAMVPRPSYEGRYREAPVKIIFSQYSDMEYEVAITGYIDELKPFKVISNDTIKGQAFLSVAANRQFLNFFAGGRYYIAELKRENGAVSILTLAEQFTNKYIKSSAVLRKAVEYHYRTRPQPVYDDYFVLRNLQKVN